MYIHVYIPVYIFKKSGKNAPIFNDQGHLAKKATGIFGTGLYYCGKKVKKKLLMLKIVLSPSSAQCIHFYFSYHKYVLLVIYIIKTASTVCNVNAFHIYIYIPVYTCIYIIIYI